MGMAGYMISMNTLDGVRILVYLAAEEALATDRAASAPNIKTLLDTNRKFSQKIFKMKQWHVTDLSATISPPSEVMTTKDVSRLG